MIEYLGPVISLGKLITAGLKSISEEGVVTRRKNFQRSIIRIQLLLEDIIDNANEILSIFQGNLAAKQVSQSEIDTLISLSYAQQHNILLIAEQLSGKHSDNIMELFTPHIRERIKELIDMKGGAISELSRHLRRFDKDSVLRSDPALYDWDSDQFLIEGHSYVRKIIRRLGRNKVSVFLRMDDQRLIVAELVSCSNELSEFIRRQMNIQEVVAAKRDVTNVIRGNSFDKMHDLSS
jgi:hypothetical protein